MMMTTTTTTTMMMMMLMMTMTTLIIKNRMMIVITMKRMLTMMMMKSTQSSLLTTHIEESDAWERHKDHTASRNLSRRVIYQFSSDPCGCTPLLNDHEPVGHSALKVISRWLWMFSAAQSRLNICGASGVRESQRVFAVSHQPCCRLAFSQWPEIVCFCLNHTFQETLNATHCVRDRLSQVH